MANGLNESQRRRYREDGILFPVPVLETDDVRRYCVFCDELEELLGGKPRTVEVRQMHLHVRWASDLAAQPRILDAVEGLLGPNLLVWATELFAKHPYNSAVSIGWHRDRPYMGFDSRTTVTAWIALSPSHPANGCLRVLPGPERQRAEIDESAAVDVVLQPGEMSLHDADILHGSRPNRSGEKRVGFAVRFVSPEARPLSGRPPALLVRGRDTRGHFEIIEPPTHTRTQAVLGAMKESATQHLDAMLENLRRASC